MVRKPMNDCSEKFFVLADQAFQPGRFQGGRDARPYAFCNLQLSQRLRFNCLL